MSKLTFILKIETSIVLINCDKPSIPPVYKLFGTINKLIAKDEINIPKIHLENLNHPQLKNLNILNFFVLFFSTLVILFSKIFSNSIPPIDINKYYLFYSTILSSLN